jgi:hypothetical protein
MNTLIITSQLLSYGFGIASCTLNIAIFVRRHRARQRRRNGHNVI